MLDQKVKDKIIEHNFKIADAVLVEQVKEHPGFKVILKCLEDAKKEAEHSTIQGITVDDLKARQSLVQAIIDIQLFLDDCVILARKEKLDTETGDKIPLKGE